jgi:hypothetical protein
MSKHITSKGKVIDMESILAQQGDTVAVGNMKVNAKGDLLGPGGKVVKTADQRAREFYKNKDVAVDKNVSVKSTQPVSADYDPSSLKGGPEVKTAATAKAEAKSKLQPDPQPVKEEPVKQQQEKDPQAELERQVAKAKAQAESKEPIGYKEVELPNGDIEMVPIFEDDWEE